MEHKELPGLSLLVKDEQSLYSEFSAEPEFSESLKNHLRMKMAVKEYRKGVNLTVLSEKPIDEEKFRTAVSIWICEEKALFRIIEKTTFFKLIGLLIFGSIMIVLSIILAERFDVLKYSLLPITGSLSLTKAAGVLFFEIPAMRVKKWLIGAMEKNNVISFLYDNN